MSRDLVRIARASAAAGAMLVASRAYAWQPGVAPPSGGAVPFAPAPPAAPSPAVERTVALLDQAKQDDSGRGLEWVWIDAEGGFEQLGLTTFASNGGAFTAGFVPTSASGGVVALGIGARLLYFTLLARARVGIFNLGELYRVGVEGGFHVPLGRIEPHVELGAGYAGIANLHDTVGGAAGVIKIRGFSARAGAGLDYFVAPVFSIGADVSAELLALSRPALAAGDVQKIEASPSVSPTLRASAEQLKSGSSSVGGTLSATAVLGLHF